MIPSADADPLQAYLDDALSADQRRAVETRLKAEPALARALLLLAREEAVIRRWASAHQAADAVGRAAGLPFPTARPRRPVRYAAAAAVLVVAAAAVAFFVFRPAPTARHEPPPDDRPQPPALAWLENVQGDAEVRRDGVPHAAADGAALTDGSEVATHGDDAAAVVRYADGTRLEVGAGSRLRVEAGPSAAGDVGKRVVLLEGSLGADVRRQPDGLPLVLRTPHAEVTVPGICFISTSTAAATRVEPLEGQVEVKHVAPEAAEAVVVEPGSYAVVSPQVRPIALDRLPKKRSDPFAVLPGTGGPVLAVAFGPGGRLVALHQDGFASVWDAAGTTERHRLEKPPIRFTALALSPDGRTVALGGTDRQAKAGWVTLWDTDSGRELDAWRGPRDVHALAFSPDGKTVAVGGVPARKLGETALAVLSDGVLSPWPSQSEPVHALAFSPDGKTLAVGGKDGVRLFDVESRAARVLLPASTGPVQALAYSDDGLWLAGGGKDGAVRVWETATGAERCLLFNPRGAVTSVAFTPDARLLLTAGRPGFATLWERASGRELTSFQGHKGAVCGVAVGPDGVLATAGVDRTVRWWHLLPPPRWWQRAE